MLGGQLVGGWVRRTPGGITCLHRRPKCRLRCAWRMGTTMKFVVSKDNWRDFYRSVRRRISEKPEATVTLVADTQVEVSSRLVVQTLMADVLEEGQFSLPEPGIHLLGRIVTRSPGPELVFHVVDDLLEVDARPVFCHTACLVGKRGLRTAANPLSGHVSAADAAPQQLLSELSKLAQGLSAAYAALKRYGVTADQVLHLQTANLIGVHPDGLKKALLEVGIDTPWSGSDDASG